MIEVIQNAASLARLWRVWVFLRNVRGIVRNRHEATARDDLRRANFHVEKIERVAVADALDAGEDALDLSASEVRASEVRAAEVRAFEVRASEVCVAEVHASEVRASEVRADEVRAAEIRVAEVRVAEVRVAEIRVAEVRASEVRADEVRAAEVRASEVRAAFHGHPHRKAELDRRQGIFSAVDFCREDDFGGEAVFDLENCRFKHFRYPFC